jgi:nucleoside-triphosphatase THEP1
MMTATNQENYCRHETYYVEAHDGQHAYITIQHAFQDKIVGIIDGKGGQSIKYQDIKSAIYWPQDDEGEGGHSG